MAKVIVPLFLAAFAAIFIFVGVKYGTSCSSTAYCPSGGGGSVPTDNRHYTPPDPDPQQQDWHPVFPG